MTAKLGLDAVGLLQPPMPTYATVAGTHLTTGGNGTDAQNFDTASITPTANALVLAAVESSAATSDIPTLSGCGLTWVLVASIASGSHRISLFRAMGAAPTAGAVTIAHAASQLSCGWSISEFTGVKTGGTNGSEAVGQARTGSGSATSATLTMSFANERAANGMFAAFNMSVNEAMTADPTYTELGQAGHTSPTRTILSEWRPTTAATAAASWTTSAAWRGIAVELRAAIT